MPEPIVEVKTLVQEMGVAFEEFKATHAKSQTEKDALLEEKLKKIAEEITTKHELATKRVDEIEARAKRPGSGSVESEQKEMASAMEFTKSARSIQGNPVKSGEVIEADLGNYRSYTKAFEKMVRHGDRALSQDEYKALSVGSDPDGGYWVVPAEISASITTRLFESSPVRQLANVETISTTEWKQPEDPNEADAGWVGETATRSESNTPQIGMKVIPVRELYALPKSSQQFLEDSAVNVDTWLGNKAADKMARVEATAFISGNTPTAPRGIVTYSNGTTWGTIEQVVSGSSGAFAYNGLINLITALKEPYHANAKFLVRRQSVASIMTLTDGSNRLIFQPIQGGNFNDTPLLGYPIRYATDMAAVAASSLSLAFGDFKRGYTIVDRLGISLIRDNVTAKPFVLFYFRKRVGGDVVDFDAIKLHKLST